MKFYTRFERKRDPAETNNGVRKVETAGYIPAKDRITNMILAGHRLVDSRKEQYDFEQGKEDPDYIPVHRRRAYDPAEATQDLIDLNSSLESRRMVDRPSAEKTKEVVKETTEKTEDNSPE